MITWHTDLPASPIARDLATAQSLTAALSQRGDFAVQLDALGEMAGGEGVFRLPQRRFARRVTLLLNGVAVVQAQSACAIHSRWRTWLDCGTTPLGKYCFQAAYRLRAALCSLRAPNLICWRGVPRLITRATSWICWNAFCLRRRGWRQPENELMDSCQAIIANDSNRKR